MNVDALAKLAEAARCRVFGHEDAANGPQREVLAALIRGFDHPDATTGWVLYNDVQAPLAVEGDNLHLTLDASGPANTYTVSSGSWTADG